MNALRRKIILFFINHLFSGSYFFKTKRFLLRRLGAKIGKNTKIVGPVDSLSAKVIIGSECWIGKNISFEGNGTVSIGNNIDIGPNVVFATGGHHIGDSSRRAGKGMCNSILVEDGTWIGTRVMIINNTTIGKSCVIAAGAVVISSLPDNILAAGVPAKIKKELP